VRRKESLRWIPLFVDKWLYGSTRDELAADEQAVWTDFLCLGAKDDGFIRANVGFPYTEARLAGLLGRTEELIHRTIEKCLNKWTNDPNEKPKLTRLEDSTLYITNWEEYQFSDRYLRFLHSSQAQPPAQEPDTRIASGKAEVSSGKADPIVYNNILEDIIKHWNEFAEQYKLAKIYGIQNGSVRERHIKARLEDKSFSFSRLLDIIRRSPFLLGLKTDFRATFDWIILPTNYQKIIEGNYLGNERSGYQVSQIGKSETKPDAAYWAEYFAERDRLLATGFDEEELAVKLAEWTRERRKK